MASELLKRVQAAAALRLRPGSVTIGGEKFIFNFRVYPAAELADLLRQIRRKATPAAAAILAENVIDPADGRPVFTGEELASLPNCDLMAVTETFLAVNNGTATEKN